MANNDLWTVLRMLEWATDYFTEKQVESPRMSIEWLLAHVLNIKRLDLYMQFDRPLTEDELNQLRPLVKSRANHQPLQYLIGNTFFYKNEFKVDSRALIPRPETEELVDLVSKDIKHQNGEEASISIIDIGTGTGCIPISLKDDYPNCQLYGYDISEEALALANENAALIKADVHFGLYDLFKPELWSGPTDFEILISNPPYILPTERNDVDDHVHNHEPHLALYCDDVVAVYHHILLLGKKSTRQNVTVYLELNPNFAAQIKADAERLGYTAEIILDISNKERFLKAILTTI